MKKLILTILLSFLAMPAYAVTDFYTGDLKTIWDANKAANNSAWTNIVNRKDSSLNDDYGILDALYCRAQNDNSYCVTAVDRIFNINSSTSGADNLLRDWLTGFVITYGLACPSDRGGASNCASALSDLDAMVSLAIQNTETTNNELGIRLSDSDELVGKGSGIFLYALAIQSDDPTRYNEIITDSFLGGWSSTDNSTVRGRIYNNFTNLGSDGNWIEATYYNSGTVQYPFVMAKIVDDVGTDYFSEINAVASNYGQVLINRHAPNPNRLFQFGDTQSRTSTYTYAVCGEMAVVNSGLDNANLCSLMSDLGCFTGYHKMYKYVYLNGECTNTERSGQTNFTDDAMGQFYWHEDASDNNNTFFGGHFRPFTAADHDSKGWRNFNLWRSNGWAINNPKFYFGDYYQEGRWINTTIVRGGLPTMPSEARGIHLSEGGSNYMYAVGVAGGHQVRSFDTKPPEALHEHSASMFLLHHADDSDTVIQFDRINSHNPLNIGGIEYYLGSATSGGDETDIINNQGKNIVQFFAANNPSISGTRVTWTSDNGETSYWDTFIPGFNAGTDYTELDMDNGSYNWIPSDVHEYRVRLTTSNDNQHQTFANIYHQGSVPTYTQYLSSSGEAAKAYKVESGTENTLVIFNAADRTSDLPTPTASGWNSNKFDQLKSLHFFKQGFTLTFSADADTEVFIVDLNPSAGWEYAIDGGAVTSLEESAAGLYNLTVSGSGQHTIYVNNTGSQPPTCSQHWDYCLDQTSCEAATWCWEDRGSGNDCYETCTVSGNCSTDCFECTDQSTCEASTASDCDGTGMCCWHATTSTCDSVPEPDCDDDCTLCNGQTECEGSALTCYYWSTDQCFPTQEPTCQQDPTRCLTEASCIGAGYAWCNDECLEEEPSEGIIESTNCSCKTDDVSTLNCTCDVESCENQIMIISVGTEETDTAPSSVVWRDDPNETTGESATLIDSHSYWFSTGGQHLYYLLDPDVGTGGKITVTHATSSIDIAMAMQTVCGLAQQAPEATGEADQDASVTSITDNAYIFSGISSITAMNFTADSPLVKIIEKDGNGQTVAIGSYQAGSAGSQDCNWTPSSWSGGGNECVAFEVSGSNVCSNGGSGGGGSVIGRTSGGSQIGNGSF